MQSLQRAAVGFAGAWRSGFASSARPQLLARFQRELSTSTSTRATDSHDDFKPKVKQGAPSGDADTVSQIEKDIASSKVFVFMKGVPLAPQCGFSNMVCRILDAYGVEYGSRNVLLDADIREGIKQYSNWPTIPQVFVNGEFVGGADILNNMHKTGELEKLLDPISREQRATLPTLDAPPS